MINLDDQGERLLTLLVQLLPDVTPGDPGTYISYKDVHTALDLPQKGETYGDSLKQQGLNSLANWTAEAGRPAVTGLIIDRETFMPGDGFFRLFARRPDDFDWWRDQIRMAKEHDWSPFLPATPPAESPAALDIIAPPARQEVTIYRVLRDTALSRTVKVLHNYECQICGHSIVLPGGSRYAEAHHIQPLGQPHNGPDILENIVCLCPNHHAELDYGVRPITSKDLSPVAGHSIGEAYIRYHNDVIRTIGS